MGSAESPKREHVSDCSVDAVTWISSGLSSWLQRVSHQKTGGSQQPPSRDVPLFWTQGSTKCFGEICLGPTIAITRQHSLGKHLLISTSHNLTYVQLVSLCWVFFPPLDFVASVKTDVLRTNAASLFESC